MPKPIVTAEVAIGKVDPVSRRRPIRPDAAIAKLASAPTTTAIIVATAAVVNDTRIAADGSMPRLMPGRTSSRPRWVHAEVDQPVGGPQRARHERAERGEQHGGGGAGHRGDESPLAGGARAIAARGVVERDRPAGRPLTAGRPGDRGGEDRQLDEREHRGLAEAAELRGVAPHLDLDRARARRGDDADHAVRREREDEHDRARRRGSPGGAGPA